MNTSEFDNNYQSTKVCLQALCLSQHFFICLLVYC